MSSQQDYLLPTSLNFNEVGENLNFSPLPSS